MKLLDGEVNNTLVLLPVVVSLTLPSYLDIILF